MKRKVAILVTTAFVLLTLSTLIAPLRAQTVTHSIVQEKNSSNRDSLAYQIDGILSSGKLVFLYFFKENCYACRLQKPVIEELEREYSADIVFVRVNGLENRKAMAEFGVIGFPTMFLIFGKNANGYECKEFKGLTEKLLLETNIDSLLFPVAESIDVLKSEDLSREMTIPAAVVEAKPESIAPTGTVYYCDSCDDCNKKIAAASSGDIVRLTADIYDHKGSCIFMQNHGVTFDGDGHTIDGDGTEVDWGVGVQGGYQDNTVQNCRIMDFYYGIFVGDRADSWKIIRNEVGGKFPNVHGISIWGAYYVLVQENSAWNNQIGIFVHSSEDTIKGNKVEYNDYGILLNGSRYNTIEKNAVEGNGKGIYLDGSNGNTLSGNTANYNKYGIWLRSSSENQVVSNVANYNTGEVDSWGVRLDYDSNDNNVTLNTVSRNGGLGGLAVYRSYYNYIMNNTVTHNEYYGVWIRESYYIIVWWNVFSFNKHGIYLVETTYYIWIASNKVESNQEYGIRLEDCNYTYIWPGNKVYSNKYGIYLWGNSDWNYIENNQIVSNAQHGVHFEPNSNNCTLTENVICRNLIDIKDLDKNWGDENTCNTPDGWNDDGTTGCTYSCPSGWCYDYTISDWINPPATGDWNVNHVIECNDTEITLNGNLWISEELRFNNVHLMINVTNMETLPPYTIEVADTGTFLINSKDGWPSIIENGENKSAYYTFQVRKGSRFEMRNSELRNCGFAWNLPDYDWAGLWIATDGVIIENNLIEHNHFVGIFFYNSSHHVITSNRIKSNDWYGIYGINSTDNRIEHNWITSNGQDGISLSRAHSSLINNNTINSNGQHGLELSTAPNSNITNNVFNSNGWDGMTLSNGPFSFINSNTANSNGDDGIVVLSSDNTTITNNTADDNGDEGILLSDSPGSLIADNYPDRNGDCGIYVTSSPNTEITRNIANSNNHGIYVTSSHHTQITFNTANFNDKTTRHSTGIYVISSSNSRIDDNIANSNWRGIYLEKSSDTTIRHNVASSNVLFGIHLYLSPSNTLSDNNVDGSTGEWDSAGIYLSNSEDNAIVHNEVNRNWFGMVLWESPHAHIELNNVNHNPKDGISLELSGDSFIAFNNATNNDYGISIVTSDYVTIMNNNATCNGGGIYLSGSDWAQIFNNLASDNSGTGIYLRSSHHNSIHDNFADRNTRGIYLSSSTYNGVFNNTATDNYFGISLTWSSNHNDVLDNDAKLCIDYGAYVFRSDTNVIIHNDFSSSGSVGIYLEQSHDNDVVDNDATSATNYGINLFESDRNLLDLNDVRFGGDIGIELSSSNYNNLTRNTAERSDIGFSIRFSNNNLLADNTATGHGIAIYLLRSANNGIFGNSACTNNNVGIDLSLSDSNEITENIVNENPNYGIHLYSSEMNLLERNTVNMNGVGIFLDWSEDNTIVRNTVNTNEFAGIAVYWMSDYNRILHNEVNFNMNVSIRISSSSFNHIEGNDASLNAVGIFLDWAENNVIAGNTADSNAYHGITLDWFSNNNEIIENSATGGLVGIALDLSSNNIISYNNASLNDIGISLEWLSNGNTVIYNTMLYNEYHGLSFHWESNENLVHHNVIGYNNEYGVYIHESINNTIYQNEIIYNTIQAFATDLNTWDNGYPSGGNYWSDYTGADIYSGPLQDITGEDGIGDTPYLIDIGNVDRYPLMKPYTPQRILVYTDKHTYHVGEKMRLGLHVVNLEGAVNVCVEIWVERPGGGTHTILHAHDVTLPAGLDYNNPSFRTFTLPAVAPGIYTWHAALLDPTTHAVLLEDTAEWEFV